MFPRHRFSPHSLTARVLIAVLLGALITTLLAYIRSPLPAVRAGQTTHRTYRGKRALDMAGALAGLVLTAPLMLLIALVIRLTMGAPVLFRQQRPGLHGQPFTICKFRTMVDLYDVDGKLLPDKDRLTRLGRFLRSTSLDELPELWNVLKGDMSLVGPRPLLMQYLERYTPDQAQRHAVKPGITGWAQINGRNGITWEEKFALDVWYVEHHSPGLDLMIIAATPWKIIQGQGINQEGQATVVYFQGNS
jgi:sugar transferase EpsL